MGNASTKEAGSPYDRHNHSRTASASSSRLRGTTTNDPGRSSNPLLGASGASSSSSRRNRDREREAETRHQNLESALLTMGLVAPSVDRHRDRNSVRTKEEEREAREAKKAEREREKEKARQKSLREESCDGGYLVTHGVYTAAQDYKDKVVRHLIIERKLAPFFKGLPDHEDTWTDAQLVAAVRGLPIPGPDAVCPPDPMAEGDVNPTDSNPHLAVPTGNRSRAHSDSSTRSCGIAIPSSSRTRSKTLSSKSQANTTSTSNPLETKIEGNYVDGRPIEAVLYKEAIECPICFLYYPPWTNKTRCCDYNICSECFVQIKRADPHLPEHEQDHGNAETTTNPDLLISEPACCPFCKEPYFGVVYRPPPFRRGIVYADSLAPACTPESSHPGSPSQPSSPSQGGGLRRKIVLPSTAPEVVTTDQIRPDWEHKLNSARSQAARRAAAATALHTAAFLLNNTRDSGAGPASSSGFPGRRLIRRAANNGSDSPSSQGSGSGSPRTGDRNADGAGFTVPGIGLIGVGVGPGNRATPGRTDDAAARRRSRIVDLEEMMLREAIRLSILEEEQRKKKEEAEAASKREEGPQAGAGGGEGSSDGAGKGKTVDRSGSGIGVGEASSSGRRGSASNLSNNSGALTVGSDESGSRADGGENSGNVAISANGDDILHPKHGSRRGSAADVKAVEAGITVIDGDVRRIV